MKAIKLSVIVLMVLAVSARAWTQDEESVPQPDKPIAQLEAQAAHEPNNARLLHQLGAGYFYQARNGDVPALDKGIANLERSVALAPGDVTARRSLGVAYLTKVGFLARSQTPPQELTAAIQRTLATLEKVLERLPSDPVALSLHGSTLTIVAGFTRNQQMLVKGVEEMNRAVKENPASLGARLNRGFTLLNLPPMIGDQKTAIADLNFILGDMPKDYNDRAKGVIHVLIGDAYLEMKDSTRATAEYDAAASLSSPAAEEAHARLAAVKQGQSVGQAIARYRGNLNDCSVCHAAK